MPSEIEGVNAGKASGHMAMPPASVLPAGWTAEKERLEALTF